MNKQVNREYLDNLRHSTSHLLAAAVMDIYPNTKPTLGPPIDEGFYYDFDFGDTKISENDLSKIEAKMKELVKEWKGFVKKVVTTDEAKSFFKENPYKIELIEEFSKEGKKITLYRSGNFTDLCRGGHTESPDKDIKYFKLTSLAGAYWRGSEKNAMLTRIYGTVFPSEKELKEFLAMKEEAKKRDHRKIGKELDLFTFSELVGAGFPLYTPKGALIRRLLNDYVESVQVKAGYTQVWTPQVGKAELFKISGHYDKYKDDMFRVVSNYSEEELFLKPMNCPQHTQIYASRPRSYKDLPLRLSDFAMLYRDEKPGELSGLARVRSFSQDDCHIFCREDQVDDEIDTALSMIKEIMAAFGFKYRYRLSTRDPKHPEKYLGDPKIWDKVEKWAEEIMVRNKIDHYEGVGEASFYAPKMDLMAMDALNREWQLSTVQIDYVQPKRFNLSYTDSDGTDKTPVMIHRAIIGSPERFIMILLEHFAGSLPVWLSPVQIKILPITDRNVSYAKSFVEKFQSRGFRTELDDRSETLQAKIRDAQLEKIPYMVILGDKEENAQNIAVRLRNGKDLGQITMEEFVSRVKEQNDSKSLDL